MNRRDFLSKSLKGTAGLIAISVLPLGLSACSTDKKNIDTSSLVNLGALTELQNGNFPKKIPYNIILKDAWTEQQMEGFVYVNKNIAEDSLLIMSPICTHLGCIAGNTEEGMQQEGVHFIVLVMGGEYDQYGINIGGPPPRPLDIFESFVQDGNVYIAILNPIERQK